MSEIPFRPSEIIDCANNETYRLLHQLWTKAVGTHEYDKKQWKDFESQILKLIRNQK